MSKFKVGDKVRVLDFRGSIEPPVWAKEMDVLIGRVKTVTHISTIGRTGRVELSGNSFWWNEKWLELFEVTIKTKETTQMASSSELHNSITLSEDDQLLVKEGAMTVAGNLTSDGQDMILQVLFDKANSSVKADIIAALRALPRNQKKEESTS